MKKCYIALGGIGRSLLEKYIDSSNSNESLYLSFDTDDSYEEKPRNNFKYIKFNKDLVASNIDEYIDSIPTFSECFCDEFFDTDNIELIVILSSFGNFGSNVVFEIIDKAVREIKGVLSRRITIGLKFLVFSWKMFKHSLPTSLYKTYELNTTKLIKRFQESVIFDSEFYPSINSTYYDYIKFFLLDSHISHSELFKIISMNDDELANMDVKNKYIELVKGLTTETYIKNGEQASPYSGSEPYIFISYSHKDSTEVNGVITYLQHQGFRIWYDQGIDPGTEWDENIAKHVIECTYFIAFISSNYLNSDNCKDELKYARDLNKERLIIYLEECELPPGIAMRMNRSQSIHKYRYESFNDFGNRIIDSKNINSCKYKETTLINEEPSTKSYGIKTTYLDDNGFREMMADYAPEFYEEVIKDYDVSKETEELFEYFEPKSRRRILKEWIDCYKNKPKSPKVGTIGRILITIYLLLWGCLCYFSRFPLWRIAEECESLGYESSSTLDVLSKVFWGAHVAMWALGIILIFIYFLKPERKKYICTILLSAAIIMLTFFNYNNVEIENSAYKCTPTLKIYFCDESTHHNILQNKVSTFDLQSENYTRSDIPDHIYGEHFYLDEEFIVITKNSKTEWECFTNNMNLPEDTYALYIPTKYMRYVSVAGKYGG